MTVAVPGAGGGRWFRWGVAGRLWSRRRRALFRLLGMAVLVAGMPVVGSVVWVQSTARPHLFDAADVPAAPVALVLGAQVSPSGDPSPFLVARLELARRLYAAGRVRAVLVSGDHGRWSYDEPDAMRRWLVDRGVPAGRVVADYAGFDTYDSCVRARRVFGVRQATVVTQDFHLARAVAVCRAVGVDATGVGDGTARQYRLTWLRGAARDQAAAVKAVLDVSTGRDPVFLGRHEDGVDRALAG
ncbi:vancomycin high temperature exclusion protein [Plantactinospora siamensis]|uniref:Vancomycin high temperature exclusion protein n=1 Tax=Plantactinospora siamensis TaxID=555372 RepID=A0ABV6NYS3_9ACTN